MPIETLALWQLVGIDWIGPFPMSDDSNRYILHIIDYFSRFSMAEASKDARLEDTIRILEQYVYAYTHPAAIYADPGRHFDARIVKDFCTARGILLTIGPTASRSTGMVEKGNDLLQRTIMKSSLLRIEQAVQEYAATHFDWDRRLPKGMSDLNARHISHLGFSPCEIALGCQLQDMGPMEWSLPTQQKLALQHWIARPEFDVPADEDMATLVLMFIARRQRVQERTFEADKARRERQKERYDRGVTGKAFYPGQLVMMYDTSNKGKKRKKLQPTWRGPFVVTGYGGEHQRSYTLRQLNGRPIKGHFHGDHLVLFKLRYGHIIPPIEASLPEYQRLRAPRAKPPPRSSRR